MVVWVSLRSASAGSRIAVDLFVRDGGLAALAGGVHGAAGAGQDEVERDEGDDRGLDGGPAARQQPFGAEGRQHGERKREGAQGEFDVERAAQRGGQQREERAANGGLVVEHQQREDGGERGEDERLAPGARARARRRRTPAPAGRSRDRGR